MKNKRDCDLGIAFQDSKKKKNFKGVKAGDNLDSACNIQNFENNALTAVVFCSDLIGSNKTLLDGLHQEYYQSKYIGLEIVVVTGVSQYTIDTFKQTLHQQYHFSIFCDEDHTISKNYRVLENNIIKQRIILVDSNLIVATVIESFSAENVAREIKKIAIDYIDLDTKGTEEALESGSGLIVVFFVNDNEIQWRRSPGNLPAIVGDDPAENRSWETLVPSITNGGVEPCGTPIYTAAIELGAASKVFEFKYHSSLHETMNRTRNAHVWAQHIMQRDPVFKYIVAYNQQKKEHVSQIVTNLASFA